MQKELLEKYPSSNMRVYAIWFSMLPIDARSNWRWTGNVLSDRRVSHFWDENKIVGRWFAKQENPADANPGIEWDAYFLYGPDAQWEAKPEPLISGGGTVRDQFDELRRKLAPLLTPRN